MKRSLAVLATVFLSMVAMASDEASENQTSTVPLLNNQSAFYGSKDGCTVEVQNVLKGTLYFVTKNNRSANFAVTHDRLLANFNYCASPSVKSVAAANQVEDITISCPEHVNGNLITSGKIHLIQKMGQLKELTLTGNQNGRLDLQISCLELSIKNK
jgi:hypothetical protein